MANSEVLVRAAGGEPVKLLPLQAGNGLVYVANPESLKRVLLNESWPVGVPAEDVFCFEDDAYRQLRGLWSERGKLTREEWRRHKLQLYRP